MSPKPTTLDELFGKVAPPPQVSAIGSGAGGINQFLNNALILLYIVSAIICVFFIVFGAIQWITSAGDKTALKAAQDRIKAALIGLVILSLVAFGLRLFGQITGFTNLF